MREVGDESELIHKLVMRWHLSVPERRALPRGSAKASLVCAALEEAVRADGWFPTQWRPEEPFAGGLIEYRPDSSCRIYWKSEVGLHRFAVDAVEDYRSLREAIPAFVRGFFGNDIDGVPIDWNA